MYKHKTLLVDSQVRQLTSVPELRESKKLNDFFIPWTFTGIDAALDGMSKNGWEHYQSLELTDKNVCDNASKHGVLLFFRKPKNVE